MRYPNQPLDPKLSRLTTTERRIIALLASGLTFDEVSQELNCSVPNIYQHLKNARQNLCIANTRQLIAVCGHDGEIVKTTMDQFISSDEALGRIDYKHKRVSSTVAPSI